MIASQNVIIEKLQTFSSSYVRGKNHFENDGTQKYLVFQQMYRYFKKIGNTDHISSWKSNRLSHEYIKPPTAYDNRLATALSYIGNKTRVQFNESYLKQDKITFTHRNTVNIYIVYELRFPYSDSSYPTYKYQSSIWCS